MRAQGMTMSDRRYYARRAMQELRRAEASENPAVVEIHKLMQRAYAERTATGGRDVPRPEEIG